MKSLNNFQKQINVIKLEKNQLLRIFGGTEKENQIFTSVSNVLEAKHDTQKNVISNIR
jgi:hypothetical protein